jgi:exonuclease VII large subunit
MDSIPPVAPFMPLNNLDWEEFANDFEKSFEANFSEFYKTHEKDFDKMMKELESKYNDATLNELRVELDEMKLSKNIAAVEQEMAVREEAMAAVEKAMAAQEESMSRLSENMQRWEKEHAQQLERMEKELKAHEENMKKFEVELGKELVKDGYIKKDEKIKDINWNEDGIKVNGKKIKASDTSKYQKLYKKYINEKGDFNYIYSE